MTDVDQLTSPISLCLYLTPDKISETGSSPEQAGGLSMFYQLALRTQF